MSLSAPAQYVDKIAYKTSTQPFPQCFIDHLMDTCPKYQGALLICILIESAGAGMCIIELIFPVQHIKQKLS